MNKPGKAFISLLSFLFFVLFVFFFFRSAVFPIASGGVEGIRWLLIGGDSESMSVDGYFARNSFARNRYPFNTFAKVSVLCQVHAK